MEKIMTPLSLQDVMKDVATHLDQAARDECCAVNEEQAYEALDPVLSSLRKHLSDAKTHYKQLTRDNGTDDPMTEIARDMADSAQSAYDTRLIEMRANKKARRQIRKMLTAATQRNNETKLTSLKHRYKMDLFQNKTWRERQVRRAEKEGRDGFFTSMILLWLLHHSVRATHRNLQLANIFLAASTYEQDAKVA